jgi:hypothetical protein
MPVSGWGQCCALGTLGISLGLRAHARVAVSAFVITPVRKIEVGCGELGGAAASNKKQRPLIARYAWPERAASANPARLRGR